MNQQERQALQDFIQELARARVRQKDPEAEAMILRAVANLPNAPYLLVQRVLLQEQALAAAQQKIASLQRQLDVSRPQEGRFLDPASDWGHSDYRHSSHGARRHGAAYRYGEPRGYHEASMGRPGLMSGGMGSFLGSMAGAAAGVAAGSFLYHGIEDLLHRDHDDTADQQGFPEMSGGDGRPDRLAGDAGWTSGDGGGELAHDAGIDDIGWSDDSGMEEGGDYA